MAAKKTILNVELDSPKAAQLYSLSVWDAGWITQPQRKALKRLLLAEVPCMCKLEMRTRKGALYVSLGGMRKSLFLITQRAEVQNHGSTQFWDLASIRSSEKS